MRSLNDTGVGQLDVRSTEPGKGGHQLSSSIAGFGDGLPESLNLELGKSDEVVLSGSVGESDSEDSVSDLLDNLRAPRR